MGQRLNWDWVKCTTPRSAAGDLLRLISVISFYQALFCGDSVCVVVCSWSELKTCSWCGIHQHRLILVPLLELTQFWSKTMEHILFCGPVEFYFPRGELIRPRLSGWAGKRPARRKTPNLKKLGWIFRLSGGLEAEIWHTSLTFFQPSLRTVLWRLGASNQNDVLLSN